MVSGFRVGLLCLVGLATTWARPVVAEPVRAAIFPFELDDTSLVGATSGQTMERPRLAMLDAELRTVLTQGGRYAAIDITPVAPPAHRDNFRGCNGCEVELAQRVGAQVSVIGWVQKVSNLILNINVVMRSIPDGRVVHAASVDIRGDTDESWKRGLDFLMRERLFLGTAGQ